MPSTPSQNQDVCQYSRWQQIYEVKDINKVNIDEWSTPGGTYQVKGAVIELGEKYQRPSMSEFNKG